MLFCSLPFFYFFCVIFAVYWSLPWQRARVWLLLIASFYFYASWNKQLALLIGVTTVMDYLVARGMDATDRQLRRRFLLGLSLVVNLGILVYFKYANFFLHSLEAALRAGGATASLPVLKVILPVGISFYTFEAINYTVDVFRRRVRAERNLANFMLFITFFPHLVAGPIVRARDFLPQIHRLKRWDWLRLQLGVQYLLMGLFKKWAIADHMAQFADPVFASPGLYSTAACWIATLAYTLQIYCDFSGYTDMALGCAHMLGYKLAINFNMPYLARNAAEFWHRWHISLSTWLRDYLFIPLGGSRGTAHQTRRNLLLTMTLGGLWHGANWTFVIWGVYHGLLLIGHRLFAAACKPWPILDRACQSVLGTVCRWTVTMLAVMLGWVLFRATTLPVAASVLHRLFVPQVGMSAPMPAFSLWCLLVLVAACHAIGHYRLWKWAVTRLPAPALGFGYATALTLALLLAPATGKAFIYFVF
jgi:alginate O-acetyltransferase complex protein AlgI